MTAAIGVSEAATEAVTEEEESIAALDGLHVTFPGGVRALRGVSLAIRPGEILGLVGESGSGKSVLGLALLGLLPEQATVEGHAIVAGCDMVHADARAQRATRARHLGAVFQDPMTSLNPTMRIGPQVAEAIGPGADRRTVVELLGHVGVPQPERRLGQYPHELSGGLRQRVMVAMAVAGSPSLVVADEPTTALDVTTQAQVLRLMARLREETRTAFLLITHDLAVASAVADRIAVLYGGRLMELGPARAVLDAAGHPYTRALLDVRLTRRSPRGVLLHSLEGEPPNPRNQPPGCPFAPRCELAVDRCEDELPRPLPSQQHDGLVACHRAAEPGVTSLRVLEPRPSPPTMAGAQAEPALTIEGLHKHFRVRGAGRQRLQAVRDVALTVPARGSLALVGESGCGKSTLLRVAAGLTKADRGRVRWSGGRRPQMVFQDAGASLTPWLTVGQLLDERLALARVPKPAREQQLRATLSRIGLPYDVLARKPRQLSGGQRQRVAIARAIVAPPDLLLCDEPISALDVSLAAQVLNLLIRLRAELGMAMLFVTHDLAAARLIADEIAVMYRGAIVEQGPAAVVLERPFHPYTRALLDALPDAPLVTPAAPLTEDPAEIEGGCRYRARCPLALPACAEQEPRLLPERGRHRVACPVVEVG
jgi:peptide/nickel transport system ATP-binding protein